MLDKPSVSNKSMTPNINKTQKSILTLTLCGLLAALCCAGAYDEAAARGLGGGGRMGGGGRSFGGMHNGGSGTGRSSYSSRTTTTNHNASTNTSGANGAGANAGSKTTTAPGTSGNSSVSNSTAATGSGSAGSKTTTGSGTTSGSGTGSAATTTGGAGSAATNPPGTANNATGGTRGGATTVSSDPGRGVPVIPVATGGGIGRGPGSPLPPNLPPAGGGVAGGGFAAAPQGVAINFGGSGVPPRGELRFVPNEIVTEFAATVTPQAIDQLARRYNLTLIEQQGFPLIGTAVYRWHINGNRSVADTIGGAEGVRGVARAQPNYVFALQDETAEAAAETSAKTEGQAASDTVSETAAKTATRTAGDLAQYVLGKLEIEEAHRLATGKNIPIAVIDSEIDGNHPDLGGTIAKSFDPLGGDKAPHEHGTAMAGAIAAHGKLSGIASGPQLLAARAFDNTAGGAKGTSFAIYKSLQWAADNGARVVNMSFAGPVDSELHRFLVAAHDKGIVLVAAAGNAGPKAAPMYPAADPDVIAVTATDSNDGLFAMANRGAYIAVAAPGVEILALAPGDSYQLTTGTSVAAAHVSGIAAMLLEENPSLTPDQVRSVIMSTAKPLASGGNADFGAGLADALRAVTALSGGAPVGREEAEQAKQ